MLLCDGCDKGFHTYCPVPAIEEIPDGDWFCSKCSANENGEGGTPGSEESKRLGSGRSTRRRKSRWSSGVVPKKKSSIKKKILESDEEEANEEAKENTNDVSDGDKAKMETSDLDLTPRSPQPNIPHAVPSSNPGPSSSAAQNVPAPDTAVEADPSIPTGVRIDNAKVLQWSNDLVRFTDNFPVEKLERVYTSMAKVSTST